MTFWDFAFLTVIVSACVAVVYILRWHRPLWQTARVTGTGNYVDQRGAVSDGDVVGGDLVRSGKDEPCQYCGGR